MLFQSRCWFLNLKKFFKNNNNNFSSLRISTTNIIKYHGVERQDDPLLVPPRSLSESNKYPWWTIFTRDNVGFFLNETNYISEQWEAIHNKKSRKKSRWLTNLKLCRRFYETVSHSGGTAPLWEQKWGGFRYQAHWYSNLVATVSKQFNL